MFKGLLCMLIRNDETVPAHRGWRLNNQDLQKIVEGIFLNNKEIDIIKFSNFYQSSKIINDIISVVNK
jgi:hypothetical protein